MSQRFLNQKFTSYSYTAKNIGYIAISAVSLGFISKSFIRRNRDKEYTNDARIKAAAFTDDQADDELNKMYSKIAQETKNNHMPSTNKDGTESVPPSEYVGVGSSYLSRKQGDRLNLLDFKK